MLSSSISQGVWRPDPRLFKRAFRLLLAKPHRPQELAPHQFHRRRHAPSRAFRILLRLHRHAVSYRHSGFIRVGSRELPVEPWNQPLSLGSDRVRRDRHFQPGQPAQPGSSGTRGTHLRARGGKLDHGTKGPTSITSSQFFVSEAKCEKLGQRSIG